MLSGTNQTCIDNAALVGFQNQCLALDFVPELESPFIAGRHP